MAKRKKLTKFQKATRKFKGKKLGELRSRSRNVPRTDPLWTLEDGVSYSDLSAFDTDRNKFHISKVQGWRPKSISFALEFGNVFHLMCEAQDRCVPLEHIPRIAWNYIKACLDSSSLDEQKTRELNILGELAVVTFQHYVDYWQRHPCFTIDIKGTETHFYEKDFDWIEKEQNFKVPYRLPNGRKIPLRGKRDGAFKISRKVDGIWLFETKTKGNIDAGGITAGLHKDVQTGLYMTSLEIEKKVPPAGVLYNVIRRTSMKPRVHDTPKQFAERVEEDIMKRPEWYFMRWTRAIDKDDLHIFQQRTLNPLLYQLTVWWDSIKKNPMDPWHDENGEPNPHHWERGFGMYDEMQFSQRGSFFEIITDNNYFNYEQRQYAFPELDDPKNNIENYI